MRSQQAPVFLLGPARSGTTLLFKVLCQHPDAAYISNWVRRFPMLPQLAILNRIPRRRPARRNRVWFDPSSNAYVYGGPRRLGDRLFPMPAEGEPVFRRAGFPGSAASTPADLDLDRLRRDLAAVQRWGGGRVLLNKRIANNRRVRELRRAFPEARFVVLMRDGRAVARSLSRVDWWADSEVWWYGGTPRDWERAGGDPWELCARNWVAEVDELEHGMAEVPPDQLLLLRYESFVAAPTRTLREVADFAGLAANETWLSDIAALSYPDRNEAWRQHLDPDVVARIEGVQRRTLERYGYLVWDAAASRP